MPAMEISQEEAPEIKSSLPVGVGGPTIGFSLMAALNLVFDRQPLKMSSAEELKLPILAFATYLFVWYGMMMRQGAFKNVFNKELLASPQAEHRDVKLWVLNVDRSLGK